MGVHDFFRLQVETFPGSLNSREENIDDESASKVEVTAGGVIDWQPPAYNTVRAISPSGGLLR